MAVHESCTTCTSPPPPINTICTVKLTLLFLYRVKPCYGICLSPYLARSHDNMLNTASTYDLTGHVDQHIPADSTVHAVRVYKLHKNEHLKLHGELAHTFFHVPESTSSSHASLSVLLSLSSPPVTSSCGCCSP